MWKKETNKLKSIGIGEPGLDNGLELEHRCRISGIRRLRLARPTSKEATELARAGSDHRPGVSALGKRA